MTELSEELIAELKEAFSLFDRDADNRIKTSELPLVVRALNQNPTEAELEEMIKEVDPEDTRQINFSDFVALVLKKWRDIDPEEELLEAFQVFDKERTGYIQAAELKHMLAFQGEKLNDSQVEDFLKRSKPDEAGLIAYEPLVKLLTRKFA